MLTAAVLALFLGTAVLDAHETYMALHRPNTHEVTLGISALSPKAIVAVKLSIALGASYAIGRQPNSKAKRWGLGALTAISFFQLWAWNHNKGVGK